MKTSDNFITDVDFIIETIEAYRTQPVSILYVKHLDQNYSKYRLEERRCAIGRIMTEEALDWVDQTFTKDLSICDIIAHCATLVENPREFLFQHPYQYLSDGCLNLAHYLHDSVFTQILTEDGTIRDDISNETIISVTLNHLIEEGSENHEAMTVLGNVHQHLISI